MEATAPNSLKLDPPPFLRGGGEMGGLIRAYDWSKTPLGLPYSWPQSLRATLGTVLAARFPMLLFWGPELIQFYNDAYRPSLGAEGKHPTALGQPARECWADVWHTIGPMIDRMMAEGETQYYEDLLVPIIRNGGVEDVYWTFSYSPAMDEGGRIAGVLVVCIETTEKVVNVQRLIRREEELRQVIENTLSHIPTGILLFEADGRMTFSNKAAEEDLHGALDGAPVQASYAETMAIAMEKTFLLNEAGLPLNAGDSILQKAFKTGLPQELTYQRITKRDGSRKWYLSHAIPLTDDGKVARVLIANTDITAQKEAAQKLAASQRQLETILDNIPAAIYFFEHDGQMSFANKAAVEEMRDSLEGQAIPQKLAALVPAVMEVVDIRDEAGHPIDPEASPTQAAFKTGAVTELSFQRKHRQREDIRWFVNRAIPLKDEAGAVTRVLTFNTDITAERIAAEKLRESEEQFRIFANNLQNLAWIADGDGWIFWYNQRWYDYTGTSLEEMEGWGWQKVHHPEHIERVLAFWQKAFLQDEPAEMIFPLRHKDGRYRWFLTRAVPVFDESGKRFRWVGTNTDIHEQVLAEEAAKESESRFRMLAETLPQMVWVTNADGSIQEFISGKWQEYFGPVSSGEAWENMSVPEERDAANAAFAKAIAAGVGFHAEIRLRNKQGQYRWHVSIGVPVKDASGAVRKWVGSVIDIHDQKTIAEKLEAQVAERTTELQRSNEDLERFAHVASHDLKEPMRKIQTFGYMLKGSDGPGLSERGGICLDKMLSASDRMMNMITGVLEYSKIGSVEGAADAVPLNDVIAQTETDLEVVIAQKGASIIVGSLPEISGVTVLIHQLFYNLVNNALKFGRAGVPPRIIITGEAMRNGFAKIVLADNGIGFEPEYAEMIFKTFARLNTKDQYEGTGLGLSLCQKIVERHGGSIIADGKPGEGATFVITLPLS